MGHQEIKALLAERDRLREQVDRLQNRVNTLEGTNYQRSETILRLMRDKARLVAAGQEMAQAVLAVA